MASAIDRPPRSSSILARILPSSSGSLTAQSFWGASRMRAPLAPPRKSDLRNVEAGVQDLRLERRDVAFRPRGPRGNRILPDEILRRHFRPEVPGFRPHIAVG